MIKERKPSYIPDKFYVRITSPLFSQSFKKWNYKKANKKKQKLEPLGYKVEYPIPKEEWINKRRLIKLGNIDYYKRSFKENWGKYLTGLLGVIVSVLVIISFIRGRQEESKYDELKERIDSLERQID